MTCQTVPRGHLRRGGKVTRRPCDLMCATFVPLFWRLRHNAAPHVLAVAVARLGEVTQRRRASSVLSVDSPRTRGFGTSVVRSVRPAAAERLWSGPIPVSQRPSRPYVAVRPSFVDEERWLSVQTAVGSQPCPARLVLRSLAPAPKACSGHCPACHPGLRLRWTAGAERCHLGPAALARGGHGPGHPPRRRLQHSRAAPRGSRQRRWWWCHLGDHQVRVCCRRPAHRPEDAGYS